MPAKPKATGRKPKMAKKTPATGPLSRTALGVFLAIVATVRAEYEERKQTDNCSHEARFNASQKSLKKVVDAAAVYTGRGFTFSPIYIFKNAQWGAYGLLAAFNLIFGHFETESLNLKGDLFARRTNFERDGLRSAVWNLLYTYLGASLFKHVVVNIVPFTGAFDKGASMWKDIPKEARTLMDDLRKEACTSLGSPEKVGGFGTKVITPLRGKIISKTTFPSVFLSTLLPRACAPRSAHTRRCFRASRLVRAYIGRAASSLIGYAARAHIHRGLSGETPLHRFFLTAVNNSPLTPPSSGVGLSLPLIIPSPRAARA